MREVLAPLFRRYLFIRFSPRDRRWRDIFATLGLIGLLCEDRVPVPRPFPNATTLPYPPKPLPSKFVSFIQDGRIGVYHGRLDVMFREPALFLLRTKGRAEQRRAR